MFGIGHRMAKATLMGDNDKNQRRMGGNKEPDLADRCLPFGAAPGLYQTVRSRYRNQIDTVDAKQLR